MQHLVPGNITKLSSADTVENPNDAFRFNAEYLNTLHPNGFPQHILNLKAGVPLMLLRNINPKQGLCNGTKLIYDKTIDNKLLHCQTMKQVGVWLRGLVFGHGQLYVACSRVSLPSNLKFAVKREPNQERLAVQNIVFHEVLLPE